MTTPREPVTTTTPVTPPPLLPPVEPFPGFDEQVKTITRDVHEATKQLQQSETYLVSLNLGKRMFKKGPTVKQWVAAGKPGPFASWAKSERARAAALFPGEDVNEILWEERLQEARDVRIESVRMLGRANWFGDFYSVIPNLVEIGAIANLEDYLELMKSDPTGMLSDEDIQVARETILRMTNDQTGQRVVTPRDDAPDWLQITPEQEAEVRQAFALEPEPPETIHRITVDALLKSLTRQPELDMPEEMTVEQLLQLAAIMDIPEEELRRAVDYTELLKPYADAIVEREAQIKAVLAGEEEWEMPELSLGKRIAFTLLSPMQVAADVIRPYLEKVSYPIAGFVAYSISRWIEGTQDIETQYDKMLAMGYGPWEAMSEAHQEWNAPWYAKLGLELITDPLTYTPGLVVSIPGKILSKIPLTATRLLGGRMLQLNKGMWSALDIPFDAFKGMWSRMPKSFNQATKMELDAFRDLMIAASTKQSGHILSLLTPDDVAQTLTRAMKDFAATPMKQGDVFVDLGAELIKHAPLDEKAVAIWSRSLKGNLDSVTPVILNSVEDTVSDAILKIGSPAENAKRLAIAMGIEDTPQHIGKLIKDLGVITNKYAARVPRAIEIGKTAKFSPVNQMTEFLVSGQKKIVQAVERSSYAKGRVFQGIVLSLMNKVDRLERGKFRMTLDRWLVRPMAEAYLGSMAYPIWNAFEGIFVSALEGVVPRMAKQEAFQRMFLGVRGVDSRVMQWSASDVAGMLGTMPGREGAISLLPGKVPEKIVGLKTPKWIAGKDWFEWTGRKWIELSDVWGTGYRANFLMRKMASYLAEYSYKVAGQDLNAAFRKLIGRPPSIGKESLGLSTHELKQEMFARVTSGLKAEVLGMKEILSNNSLMRGEAMKILRQADAISPQAKTLGEQMLARGEVLKTTDDIVKFSKTLADQSVADLRAFPTQAPASFRFMADQIEGMAEKEITTADELMQVFQHFEVMADTGSRVPIKLLSQVMEEADELKRAGKFGKLESLWRTSRNDVETAVDGINDSLNRVSAVIQNKSSLLTDKQQLALTNLLERNTARISLQEQFLKFDGRLLDDFWALPKAMRTAEEHTALRAFRWENILKYKGEDAVLGAGDFLERKSYSQLYYDLPARRLIRIDATARALTADDAAKAMGANVDALTTGLMESMTFQDKAYFIQMVKQSADANPKYFKGFTEGKIGLVYDDIVRGLRMNPDADIATQKILQQVEGVKQQMIALRMNHSLNPTEEKALHDWIDDVAGGMDGIFGTKKKPGVVTKGEWDDIRQRASESAHKEYYKAFADYTNENIIDAVGKSIYPFWTYHMYRWFFLTRTFTRKPGTLAAWGKYYEYSDYGYQHIPGTDIEFNPAVGSAFGATFSLARHDFKSYYENLGFMGEVLDFTQRRGFFPGIHVTLPIALTAAFSDRPPELGEVLPPLHRVGLNLLVNSKIPGVSDAAKWLKDKIFHENFHDYYTSTIVSTMQSDAGGKLIDGQTGVDLWFKKQRGEALTAEEQQVWDTAYEEAAWIAILRSEFPEFRLRSEEMIEAHERVTGLIEAQTGLDEAMQNDLWKHNLRPADVIGGLPLDLRMALDQMWEWRIYFGRGAILMPPEYSDLFNLMDRYYDKVESYQVERLGMQTETNKGFLQPTAALHFNGKEWRSEYAKNWSSYITLVESLETDPEFADAVEAMTPEGQIRLAQELGFATPAPGPMQEAIRLYFEIELQKTTDKYTGEEDWDYLRFWLERESIRQVLPEEQRGDFDTYVRRYQTPMEVVFKEVGNTYLRGYRAVSRIVLEEFTDEEKALIAEYYADDTSRERKLEIKDVESTGGRKLISLWDSRRTHVREAIRRESPILDFWLYVFGYVSSPKTPESKAMIDAWEKDKGSIVRGITESHKLEEVLGKVETQRAKEGTE